MKEKQALFFNAFFYMQTLKSTGKCTVLYYWAFIAIIITSLLLISNSNWTEWSTIQGVIGGVISKSI